MNIELTLPEARVIGCLIEKQITTPEHYPLSLNALTNACNQKSNREPVMDLAEADVQAIVDGLVRKFHVSEHGGFGSRVAKYQHRFCNTEYGSLNFSTQELAIVCELLLRGHQTPGELRSRASRMGHFGDVGEVEAALERLARREDGPFVIRLPREPGRRESRYAHLFSGEPAACSAAAAPTGHGQEAESGDSDDSDDSAAAAPGRLERLEQRVADLEAVVALLRERLAAPAEN